MSFIFGRKQWKTRRASLRYTGTLLGATALLALAGCGGGGNDDDDDDNNNQNNALTSANLTGLTSDNRLVTFNSRTPGNSNTINVAGLTSGDVLSGIDFRATPPSNTTGTNNGLTGLYGIGRNNTSLQLYRITISGNTATATRVGTRFNLIPTAPAATAFGFDFNPTVDRIRLVEPTSNRDLRLNPNVDANTSPVVDFDPVAAGVQPDGPIRYDPSDPNAGQNPDAVGAGYNNVDADIATSTTLYILDAARNTLTIQGRGTTGSSDFVSPNDGRLFTVGQLGIDINENTGFDVAPGSNAAFLSNDNRIFGVAIAPGAGRGATTGGASVSIPNNGRLIGLAVTQQSNAPQN